MSIGVEHDWVIFLAVLSRFVATSTEGPHSEILSSYNIQLLAMKYGITVPVTLNEMSFKNSRLSFGACVQIGF